MKKLIVLSCLIVTQMICAQMTGGRNGMYGSGYDNPYGGRASMGMQNQNREKSDDEIEKERIISVEKTTEKLKTDLKLDELQLVIVKKEFDASSKKINAVIKKENLSQEEKMKEIKAINETAERNILNFLNEEQKKKFKEMIADREKRLELMRNRS